jgi:hypothetical protein
VGDGLGMTDGFEMADGMVAPHFIEFPFLFSPSSPPITA